MQTKQKKWWHRSLAMMLSLVLVLSSFLAGGMPVSFAAEEGGPSEGIYVSNTGNDTTGDGSQGNPYATLSKAYEVVNKGGTIYILDNIELTGVGIGEKPVTISTAPEVKEKAVIKRGKPSGAIETLFGLKKSQLTLKDIIIDGGFNDQEVNGRIINVFDGSKLIIEDGAILRNINSQYHGSAIQIKDNGSVVEMKGGEIRGNKSSMVPGGAVLVDSGTKFIMTGGLITENTGGGVQSRGGQIVLSGNADITGNKDSADRELNVNLANFKTLILNDTFTGKAGITTESMKQGAQFGQAATEGLTGLKNLFADNYPDLFAAYGENKALVWKSKVAPGGIKNKQPVLWLKADEGLRQQDGLLTGWEDQSFEPINFTLDVPEGTETKTPEVNKNGVNFNPSVKFKNNDEATNHYAVSPRLIGDKEITFKSGFAVYKYPTDSAGALVGARDQRMNGSNPHANGVIVMGGYGNAFVTGPGISETYDYFGTADRTRHQLANYELAASNNHSAKIDGKVVGFSRKNNFSEFKFFPVVGATNGGGSDWHGFGGDVAEIILYDQLTSVDAAKIETYLAVKYGITLNGGNSDYVDTNGNPVWNANPTYKSNIAGIGRDDVEDLLQKQSQSINADKPQVAIGLGTLAGTNAENTNLLNDKQYLIWGDNGKALTFTQRIEDTTEKGHAERIWKVQNTNNVGQVQIAIPTDAVDADTTLLISDTESFSIDQEKTLTEITLNGVSYYAATAMLEDGEYFTFAAPAPKLIGEMDVKDKVVTLTFDKEVTLKDVEGFTVKVGDLTIPIDKIQVDPTDSTKVIITLQANPDITSKGVTVNYDPKQGNLKGTNGVAVEGFTKESVAIDTNQYVDYTAITKVAGISPDGVTYDSTTEKFTVPTDVNSFTFNDGDKKMQATKGANGEWDFEEIDTNQYVDYTAITEVAGISPDGVTYDSTIGKFTVPTNVKEFTFKDGNKEMKAEKDTNGEWVIKEVETVTPPSYEELFTIQKPTDVINHSKPEFAGTVDMTTTPSTVTIELTDVNGKKIVSDGVAIVKPDGTWTFTPPTDLPDGTYTIIATATNGQQTVTKKHTFTVATTPIVNKVPLQQKVEEAKNLVAGEYTPASWAQYQEALKKANEVLANPNATQEEVDAALGKLTGAQNALVKIGKGLGTLTPSTGTLSPTFQTDVTDYTMTDGYSTSVIDFTAIPVEAGATVTTTINGQPGAIGQIPLQVGENIIVITVKDANGSVRQYTIKVYRDAYTGGGSWTPTPTPPVTPTPTPGDTKTKIQVELEIDGEKPLEKTSVEIERTKHANGDITDFVALTEANAKEAVAKAKEIGNNIARIVLPDVNDEVKEAKVEIPKESLKLLRDNGLSLEISSENGHIAIPVSSMEGIDGNFYFRLVPVKKESERQAIEERARAERVVRETLQSNDVHVVARPMTIETNIPSRPVQVTLPLKGVKIPTGAAEREAFLKQLAVFIEHSDGEKKVVIPEVVTMAKGELGLRFTVEKFSTFTIIQVNKKEETKPPLEVKEHAAYIKGFPDGTFGPEKNVTRAQVATMIARILGYTDGPVNTAPFKDIPSDHYAAGAIAFIKERGIMNGDVNGNFRASENITRAQMATVVANFKRLSIEENVAITFNDTKGHWAQWIIEANRAAGIINGRQDGSFAPDEHLTRAQAVVMMNRMFERGPLQGVTTPSFPDVKATHWAFDEIEEAAKSHSYFMDEDGNEQLSK